MAAERDPDYANDTTASVGQRLRSGREQVGLSETQVATALNLDRSVIVALEDGDFESLGAPIFVKGHLRNYAQLIKIDANDIVANYEEAGRHTAPELSAQPTRGVKMDERGGWGSRIAWIVLALIVIGVGFWGYQSGEWAELVNGRMSSSPTGTTGAAAGRAEPSDSARATESGQESRNAVALPNPQTGAGAASPAATSRRERRAGASPEDNEIQSAAPVTGAPSPREKPLAGQSAAMPTPRTGGASGTANRPLTDASGGNGASQGSAPSGTTAKATRNKVLAGLPTVAPSAGANAGLAAAKPDAQTMQELHKAEAQGGLPVALEITGDSWVEINDAAGKRLYYGLAEQGDTLYLTGKAPLSVFLGNAHHVRVLTAGSIIATSDYTRPDNTARFMIRQAGDNPAYATRYTSP